MNAGFDTPAPRTNAAIVPAVVVLWLACVVTGCTTPFDVAARRHDGSTDAVVADRTSPDASDAARDVAIDAGPDAADTAAVDVPQDEPDSCGPCERGQCCGARCVDTDIDPHDCGACGNPCPNTACLGGECTSTCLLGFADCDRNIVNGCEGDLATDSSNCGACGFACTAGRVCSLGRCVCLTGTADCDRNPANGCEVLTDHDALNCGGCGLACGPGQACSSGHCGCATGFADCDGLGANGCEVDVTRSTQNCGTCGHSCGANATCVASLCACQPGHLSCAPGALDCSVPASDPLNCGACGTLCSGTRPVCTALGCRAACGTGETRCGDSCVLTMADTANCGACGNACPSPTHATADCVRGSCGFTCADGYADCDGLASNSCEAALASDGANCGACGSVCSGSRTCSGGVCVCPSGLRDCGGGVCATCCNDAQCDDGDPCNVDRCVAGSCSHSVDCAGTLRCCSSVCRACCADGDCTGPHRACRSDGTCSACRTGFADCDGDPSNGCEADTNAGVATCGACGHACSFANAAAVCSSGACVMGACAAGYADCDDDPSDGCEVNTATSVPNCGACGRLCAMPGAMVACVAGACTRTTCATNQGDCDGMAANGCETNLSSSLANCGACGNGCARTNASATCAMGSCALVGCSTGFGNCDGNAANGCETDTTSSVANCGACGNACALPAAVPGCIAAACQVAGCAVGYGDCDASAADGCEVDVRSSVANCGTCGSACPVRANAATMCSGGACGFACDAGFADCDGDASDGCETVLGSDVANCGACAHACAYPNAGARCTSGGCARGTCNAGFADCDGVAADGCEVNTNSSVTNCGACGTVCSAVHATGACVAGVCGLGTCSAGHRDCDGALADGCEADCGAGRACASSGGTCDHGWVALATSPLAARAYAFYAIVAARHQLLVWGGTDAGSPAAYFADGAIYDWDLGTWRSIAASPLAARAFGTAVWTGGELFVWGGRGVAGALADGALYNPSTDSWRAVSAVGAPSARAGYEAVLAGTTVLVNSGQGDAFVATDGAGYDPATDTWSPVQMTSSDEARPAFGYTGSALVHFGGSDDLACDAFSLPDNTASSYAPATNLWTTSVATAARPDARWFVGTDDACEPYAWVAPWTGSALFVWGGQSGSAFASTGGLYDPAADAWTAVAPAPTALSGGAFLPIVVWTGSRILGWSIATPVGPADVVYLYDPATATWSVPTVPGSPSPVVEGAAYGWTGTELLVWGGLTGSGVSSQGGRLAP